MSATNSIAGAQYLRSISLTVGQSSAAQAANVQTAVDQTDAGDKTALYRNEVAPSVLDLSALRIRFEIPAQSASTPRQLNARVYNLSRATANLIQQEFDTVSLSAGYQGRNHLLFEGKIQQKRYGREDATDTFLDIFASDGYEAIVNCFISQTLAAGWTPLGLYNTIIAFAKPYGILSATGPGLPPAYPAMPRPVVLHENFQAACERLGLIVGMQWIVNGGVLNFIPRSKASVVQQVPTSSMVNADTGSAVVLSPSTGLIGIPVQTLDGIEATCLLNGSIKPGSFVKIDHSLITAYHQSLAVDSIDKYQTPSITADGIYRVMWTEHEGDTRGTPWYTHLVADSLTGLGTIQAGAIEKAGFNGGL